MRIIVPALALLLALASCGGEDATSTNQQETKTAGEKVKPQPATTNDFYRSYKGNIAGQPIVLHLHRFDTMYQGSYYYQKVGRVIRLYFTAQGNSLAATEHFDNVTPNNGPEWDVRLKGDSLTGTWKSNDGKKSYPILLKTDKSDELFTVYKHDKAIPYRDSIKKPGAYTSTFLLIPGQNDPFLLRTLIKTTDCNAQEMAGLEQCLRQQDEQYAKDYREMLSGMGNDELQSESNNHYSNSYMNVVYNNDDILVVSTLYEGYTGGAHGMYGTSFVNMDLRNQKVFTLEDILVIDTLRLSTMLDNEARRYFGMAPGEKISNRLFTDKVSYTRNFYITAKGITFSYGTYEIASYADGEIRLFLPYKSITDILKSDFRARMKL
jgi:hypothetical protein